MRIIAILSGVIALGAGLLQAGGLDGFERVSAGGWLELPVANGDFEAGAQEWFLGPEYRIADGAGRRATSCVTIERSDPAQYSSMSGRRFALKPNTVYRFGAYVKAEEVTQEGFCVALEMFDGEQYLRGSYLPNVTGTTDWVRVEGGFTTTADPDDRYSLAAFLRQGSTGKVWLDDYFLEEQAPVWNLYFPLLPYGTVDAAAPQLNLKSNVGHYDYPRSAEPELYCYLETGAGRWREPVSAPDQDITFRLPPVEAGPLELRFLLADVANRLILAEETRTVEAVVPAPERRSTAVDGQGRTQVNGRDFMPIGLYTFCPTREDIREISAAGFNVILPYPSLVMSLDGNQSGPVDIRKITAVLDECDARGLKVIFSLKDLFESCAFLPESWAGAAGPDAIAAAAVTAFRDHPALLAWYTCDELQPTDAGLLRSRRELIRRLDPNHPTFAVHAMPEEFHRFGDAQDIVGIDPYPIVKRSPQHDLAVMVHAAEKMRLAYADPMDNIAAWAVPQIFNFGQYYDGGDSDIRIFLEEYCYPTETEMTAMTLLEAIYGARGFLLYSHFDLKRGPDPGQWEQRWPEIRRLASLLRELQPYLYGENRAAALTGQQDGASVHAREFTNPSGEKIILIVNASSDAVRAKLEELPPQFVSATGATDEDGVFSAEGVGYDILRIPLP